MKCGIINIHDMHISGGGNMTINDIESFLTIVKYHNISKAADFLHVTQPTLTRRIQLLEAELGYQLFIRNRGQKKLELTKEGNAFIKIAKKWESLFNESREIGLMPFEKHLSIGSVYSVSHGILLDIYKDILKSGISLSLYNVLSENGFRDLQLGLYDIILIEQQDYNYIMPADFIMKPLFSEKYVIVSKDELDIDRLDRFQEIYIPWNKEFRFWHNKCFPINNAQLILEDVSLLADLLDTKWCFVPYSFAKNLDNVYHYEIFDDIPYRTIYAVYKATDNIELINDFIKKIESYIKNNFDFESLYLLSCNSF